MADGSPKAVVGSQNIGFDAGSTISVVTIVTPDADSGNAPQVPLKISEPKDSSTWKRRLKSQCFHFSLPSKVYDVLQAVLLVGSLWLVGYLLVKDENLPKGQVFTLFVLEFGGRFLGYVCAGLQLPPMVGMLGLGILIRNVPTIDFGKTFDPTISSFVRQLALAVILTRAGLGLDIQTLIRRKGLVLRLALLPTLVEASCVAIAAYLLLNFPWSWAFLLGFVVAPVSPAVVVPRLLHLRENGYGVDKGIPTVIIASASLDNIVAISLFGVALSFATAGDNLIMSVFQGPLEILMGLASGILAGIVLGLSFHQSHARDKNLTALRALLTFAVGVTMILGFRYFDYSGAGALGCLSSAIVASALWRLRNVYFKSPDIVTWFFYVMWYIFEPLLFGAIGCQMDLSKLEGSVTYKGSICILIGGFIRFLTTYTMGFGADFNRKEKLFTAITWVPKATVQAAIGPIALDTVMKLNLGEADEKLALDVLMIAVLTILITAPIGEIGVVITGKRFLKRGSTLS